MGPVGKAFAAVAAAGGVAFGVLAGTPTYPASVPPWPAPFGGYDVTVYEDDPAIGAARCAEELSYDPPGTTRCHVEPTMSAPDVSQPGWAS